MPDRYGNPVRLMRTRRTRAALPPGAIYVGRGSLFANPFQIPRIGHKVAQLMHVEWLDMNLGALFLEKRGFHPAEIDAIDRLRVRVMTQLHTLAGRDLVCWCPLTAPCHADKLLHLAPLYADYERLAA